MSRDPILAVELHGRLGNQLFRFAMVRALLPNDQLVLVETIAAADYPLRAALRTGSFRRLSVEESYSRRRPLSAGGVTRRNFSGAIRRLPGRRCSGLQAHGVYRERMAGGFDLGVSSGRGRMIFSGFFQDEQYVVDKAPAVIDTVVPISTAASNYMEAVADLGSGREPIAVVVRAGLNFVSIGWDVSLLWYLDAVEHVLEEAGDPAFELFSDIPLCAEAVAASLRLHGRAHPIVALDGVQQPHVTTRMDNVESAATSFPWGGAWLGDGLHDFASRSVVLPGQWINPGSQTASTRWSRMPTLKGPT